jgi:hypothetical protein
MPFLLFLLLLIVPAWGQAAEETLVRTFYADYSAALAKMAKSRTPSVLSAEFVQAHQSQLDPEIYANLLRHENVWADRQLGKREENPLISGCDLLTGVGSGAWRNWRVGKASGGRVPLSYETQTMRGGWLATKVTVVVSDSRISDVLYPGGGSLRKFLADFAAHEDARSR